MGRTLLGSLPNVMKRRRTSLGEIGERLEARMGKIPFSGRYHREPKKLEDDYEVSQNVLGAGYNGEVRTATSLSQPGQKCAVKTLRLESIPAEQFEQLESEVENYLSMDHPHITRLHDVYESKQQLHLVMECMEGGELFDRAVQKKQFSEAEASDAIRQMLLALNYIHSHGIVHRDVKMENFMYDRQNSGHLKLIDFGFSKMWDPSCDKKMKASLGTLSYVAPEVLNHSYTSQCDMWSLGVIGFILLGGYMPFSGSDAAQISNISKGKYVMKPARWDKVSSEAKSFIQSLLEVDPLKRLTAQQALAHPWIAQSLGGHDDVSAGVVEALRQFGHASSFRRCCMEVIAWSLSNDERAKVRNHFISLDAHKQGTISLADLKSVMANKINLVDDREISQVFEALDYNHDHEIHYSDFLAAMVDTQIGLNDALLSSAFRRFDVDSSGYITAANLRDVLGKKVDGQKVEAFIQEADHNNDGRLSFDEFAAYLKRTHFNEVTTAVGEEGVVHKTRSASNRGSFFRKYFSLVCR